MSPCLAPPKPVTFEGLKIEPAFVKVRASATLRNFKISNERPSPLHRHPYHQPSRQPYAPPPPRPFIQEDTLKAGQIQIERKSFHLTLKENPRGRFLRISEEVGGKRNSIIVPTTGLKDFERLFSEMIKASDELPSIKSLPKAA